MPDDDWLAAVTQRSVPAMDFPRWTGRHLGLVSCPRCRQDTVCARGSYIYCDHASARIGGTCGWEMTRRTTRAKRTELMAVAQGQVVPNGTIVRIKNPLGTGKRRFYAGTWLVVAITRVDSGYRMRVMPTKRQPDGSLNTRRRDVTIDQLEVWEYGYTF